MKIKTVEYPQLIPSSDLAEWEDINMNELIAIFAETGADREMCFDWELSVEELWNRDYRNQEGIDIVMI